MIWFPFVRVILLKEPQRALKILGIHKPKDSMSIETPYTES